MTEKQIKIYLEKITTAVKSKDYEKANELKTDLYFGFIIYVSNVGNKVLKKKAKLIIGGMCNICFADLDRKDI